MTNSLFRVLWCPDCFNCKCSCWCFNLLLQCNTIQIYIFWDSVKSETVIKN